MWWTTTQLAPWKMLLETIAYCGAALYLLIKISGGFFNFGMDVSLLLSRVTNKENEYDHLSIIIKLKRPDNGRIQINDIIIDLSDVKTQKKKSPIRNPMVLLEHKTLRNRILDDYSTHQTFLPPSDGTQLGYYAKVEHGVPFLVDVTIIGARSGLFRVLGRPQWRASAVSLPVQ